MEIIVDIYTGKDSIASGEHIPSAMDCVPGNPITAGSDKKGAKICHTRSCKAQYQISHQGVFLSHGFCFLSSTALFEVAVPTASAVTDFASTVVAASVPARAVVLDMSDVTSEPASEP